MTRRAYLCLGGNVGDTAATFAEALARLAQAGVTIGAQSSLYRTPPWGPVPQPHYLNQVVEVTTHETPRALLALALDVERQLGRDRAREERFGPRRIDIDILLFEGETWEDADLVLPHPRLAGRAFALVPLLEIAPEVMIGPLPAREALTALDASNIVRIA